MLTKNMSEMPLELNPKAVIMPIRPKPWQVVALVSFCVGVGSGWSVLVRRAELQSPLVVAAIMVLVTYVGWYIWGFFTHLTDVVLFGGHSDYRGTLNVFGRAYVFQAFSFFTFTNPLGWLWSWIALYVTVVAWGVIGPRHLGMRTWKAIVAVTLGMLLWLACQLILTLTFVCNGPYLGVGAFLV